MIIQLFSLSGVKNEYFFNLHLRPLLKFCNCKKHVSRFSVTVSRPYMIDDVMRIKMAIQGRQASLYSVRPVVYQPINH